MTIDNEESTHKNILRVAYADDEQPAREKLQHQLGLIEDIQIVGYATTGKEAVMLINKEQPDLIFLDIQMPEIDVWIYFLCSITNPLSFIQRPTINMQLTHLSKHQ
jgi:CheY-like chemotaxis protein